MSTAGSSSFTYARTSFWTNVAVAAGLTLLITMLSWLVLNFLAVRHADEIATAAALLFFAFCSVVFIWRYVRTETVLAIQPQGFLDIRFHDGAIPWSEVRRVELARVETDHHLLLYLWSGDGKYPDHVADLAPLEASPGLVLNALQRHVPSVTKVVVRPGAEVPA